MVHRTIACQLTLFLSTIGIMCGCGPRPAPPAGGGAAQATSDSGSGSSGAAGGDAGQLLADALATAQDINTLMRTLQQQAAGAETPTAAISANESQIKALEDRAQKLHDDVIASGRFDAGVPPELAQKYVADLEREVNLAMDLTRKGVQARSFETSVLTNAALNLNSILTVLRPRAGGAGAAAGGTAGSGSSAAGPAGGGGTVDGGGPPGSNTAVGSGTSGGAAGTGAAGTGTSGTGTSGTGAAGSAQDYNGPNAVEPTGQTVGADTKLLTGMLVLVEYNQTWYAADVLAVNADGTVRIHYRGWEATWDETVPRSRLQLVREP